MNQSDYKAIAGIVAKQPWLRDFVVEALADYMAADVCNCPWKFNNTQPHVFNCHSNTQFDRAAFIAACHGEPQDPGAVTG